MYSEYGIYFLELEIPFELLTIYFNWIKMMLLSIINLIKLLNLFSGSSFNFPVSLNTGVGNFSSQRARLKKKFATCVKRLSYVYIEVIKIKKWNINDQNFKSMIKLKNFNKKKQYFVFK